VGPVLGLVDPERLLELLLSPVVRQARRHQRRGVLVVAVPVGLVLHLVADRAQHSGLVGGDPDVGDDDLAVGVPAADLLV
jgi:hypothetical protein